MLRMMFGEPKRTDDGLLLEASVAIRGYVAQLERRQRRGAANATALGQLAIFAGSFIDALDELEQSCYCCRRFGARVRRHFEHEMQEEERDDYHRYVYFYKNAFIRIFSILDKLGYFLNDALGLHTEKVKERFSYFTVLRHMQERKLHTYLVEQLLELKTAYKPSMDKLRDERNMEIHAMNAEIWDNMKHAIKTGSRRTPIENIPQNVRDLERGFEMVCRGLIAAFVYLRKAR